jgi:hypothetical protein
MRTATRMPGTSTHLRRELVDDHRHRLLGADAHQFVQRLVPRCEQDRLAKTPEGGVCGAGVYEILERMIATTIIVVAIIVRDAAHARLGLFSAVGFAGELTARAREAGDGILLVGLEQPFAR